MNKDMLFKKEGNLVLSETLRVITVHVIIFLTKNVNFLLLLTFLHLFHIFAVFVNLL